MMKLLKRKMALALTALTLFGGMLPVAGAALSDFTQQRTYSGQFTDVAANVWYYDNVKTAYELGLVNGSSNTTYSPEDNITVAEVQTLVARIHATYHGNTIPAKSGAWYTPYIEYCMEHIDHEICGMAYMVDGGTMVADTPASRSYFAYLMYAAMPSSEYTVINTIADGSLPDVDDIVFMDANKRVYALYRAGILTGSDSQGTFHPDSNITRAEVAAIISRMIDPSQRVKNSSPYTYQIETVYNVANVREMLVDSSGTLYYTANNKIYANGEMVFNGTMPLSLQHKYDLLSYEDWFVQELATDAQHERVYALMYSWISDKDTMCIMAYDVKNQSVLGTYLTADGFYRRQPSDSDVSMQDSAVIDSSGALIYSNALKRWNFVTEPQNYIAGNVSSPETSWMHLGYSNGELMGLRTDLVRFNLNENTMERIPVEPTEDTAWRSITLISSDYDGKFYTLSKGGFGLLCIDPSKQTSELLVDSSEIQILDGLPLTSNVVANLPSIIAAGEDCWYLYYPSYGCIRKLSPVL